MIKAITFDMDMTLLDFFEFKIAGSNAAAKAMVQAGLPMTIDACKKELFEHYMTDIEGDNVFSNFLKNKQIQDERILAAGINAYLKAKYASLKPYPQVRQTILELKKKGIKVAIVSNAPRLKAFMRLDAAGIADLFEVVVGLENAKQAKPSQMPFKKALELLNVQPSEAMHIGDWPEIDFPGAKALGMKTVLAKYGFEAQPQLKYLKPDFTIEKFEDILEIVNA